LAWIAEHIRGGVDGLGQRQRSRSDACIGDVPIRVHLDAPPSSGGAKLVVASRSRHAQKLVIIIRHGDAFVMTPDGVLRMKVRGKNNATQRLVAIEKVLDGRSPRRVERRSTAALAWTEVEASAN